MGLFSNILEKLGLKKPEQEEKKEVTPTIVPPRPAPVKPLNPNAVKPNANMAPGSIPGFYKPTANAISEVDVVSKLDALAKATPEKLDWKVSIVDLLKLLELDSSLASRKELAAELKCPADKIGGDYSEMNVWLHKEVLKRIAANGGNIPPALLN
ncbi:MAG: DUF3597 domain-containing protein [Anaerolineae bacterium]|nr:DUF3597 domain-containing protein [Anaerolineae bacterium]